MWTMQALQSKTFVHSHVRTQVDAAAAGNAATLEELLANGARINDTDVSFKCIEPVLEQLQKHRYSSYYGLVQNEGYSALLMATKHGHYHCVELLLAAGADVNQRDVRRLAVCTHC